MQCRGEIRGHKSVVYVPGFPRWARPIHYALILLVHAELFIRARMAGDSDWVGAFHPLADVLRLIVLKYHQFPWWNPWAAGGMPYFALPESAVFSLDAPLALIFGAVLGPKIAIVLYTIIGYEGTRVLLRHLFVNDGAKDGAPSAESGRSRSPDRPGKANLIAWFSIVPVLATAPREHIATGGAYSYVMFFVFPWLLWLSLTWRRGVGRSAALGGVAGYMLLNFVHSVTVMAFTIAGVAVLVQLVKGARRARTWALLVLSASVAMGLSFTRIALTASWLLQARGAPAFYATTIPLVTGLKSLFLPLQSGSGSFLIVSGRFELPWLEVGCYVGVIAGALFLLGLRDWRRQPPAAIHQRSQRSGRPVGWRLRGGGFRYGRWQGHFRNKRPRKVPKPSWWNWPARVRLRVPRWGWRVRWWHVAVPVLLVMAWNDRDPFSPSYVMHRVPPWSFIVEITRWRLFACFFILIGAVGGLVALYGGGKRRIAWVLGLLMVVDLAGHVALMWHGKWPVPPPAWVDAPDPPRSVVPADLTDFWMHLRRNEVALQMQCPMTRYEPDTECLGYRHPDYRGEVWGTHPVTLTEWSPNRIVIEGVPRTSAFVNVNPGNYWRVNDERYFANFRPVELAARFQIVLPASGRAELVIRPPHLGTLLLIQGWFALIALLLGVSLAWGGRRRR